MVQSVEHGDMKHDIYPERLSCSSLSMSVPGLNQVFFSFSPVVISSSDQFVSPVFTLCAAGE